MIEMTAETGDVLEMMEYRHDWATFAFTPEVGHRGVFAEVYSTDTDEYPLLPLIPLAVQIRRHEFDPRGHCSLSEPGRGAG
jgi:hypothetical protein